MRTRRATMKVLALAVMAALMMGACGTSTQSDRSSAQASDDGHDHDSHDHSHSDGGDDGNTPTPTTATTTAPQTPDGGSAPTVPPSEEPIRASDESISEAITPEGGNELPLTVELASECVTPGGDQEIVVRSDPHVAVSYVTNYDDGNTLYWGEAYYGGAGSGETNPSGVFRDTWTLKATAAPGKARIIVRVSDDDGQQAGEIATFSVAGPTGACA